MTSSVNQQRGLDANLGHPENSIANVNDGLYEQQPILAGEKWDIWSSWLQLDDRGLDDHRVSHDPDRQTQPLGRRDRIPRSKTVLLILGLQLRHDTKLRKEPLGDDLDDVHAAHSVLASRVDGQIAPSILHRWSPPRQGTDLSIHHCIRDHLLVLEVVLPVDPPCHESPPGRAQTLDVRAFGLVLQQGEG